MKIYKTFRKTKLKEHIKQRLEDYLDEQLCLTLHFAALSQGINESKLVEKILDKQYSKNF